MAEIALYVHQDTKQTFKFWKDRYKNRNSKHAKNLFNLLKNICEQVQVLVNF